jgi:hypothetical protein
MMKPKPLVIDVAVAAEQRGRFFAATTTTASTGAALQRYAEQLVEQLDLAVVPEVVIRDAGADAGFIDGERFKLGLGGVAARVALAAATEEDPLDAVGAVAQAIFANRSLLVRHADLPSYRRRWPDLLAGVSDPDLLRCLQSLVHLCVRTSRIVARDLAAGLDAAVDACHDEALGLEVHWPASSYYGLLASPAEGSRAVLGIPLPPMVVGVDDQAPAACRLRINDAWVPVTPASVDPELQRHVALFVSGALVDLLLSSLSRSEQPLVNCVRQRFTRTMLVEVFRLVVAEGLSVANLRGVLEAMLTAHGRTSANDADLVVLSPHTGGLLPVGDGAREGPLGADELADIVRARDPRSTRPELFGSDVDPIPVSLVSKGFAADLLSARPGEPSDREAIVRRTAAAMQSARHDHGAAQVIVVSSPARRPLRRLIELELPSVRVVSWSELPDDANVAIEARIN